MPSVVQYSAREKSGIITIDSPPVNALSAAVRQGILDALYRANEDESVDAVVLICAGRTFIAGADITEFDRAPEHPWLDEVIAGLESSAKPVVAAIHGTALGGGLETALGCHYRVAVAGARCGLPEVSLGIVPGAGGTQRLPRLIGPEPALEIIASGAPIPAAHALALGLIDQIVDGDLLEGAIAFIRDAVAQGGPHRRVRDLEEKLSGFDPGIFDAARAQFAKKQRGFNAPQRAIDCVEIATKTPIEDGLRREREIFDLCLRSDQSIAQRHIFFAERAASKIPDVPKETPVLPVRSAAVIGAGTMGGGIAMNFANADIPVYLMDATREGLDKGLAVIAKNYASGVKKGRMTQEKMDATMALITPTLSYGDLADVDIVIEAVFEEMDLKKAVFGELDRICRKDAILATNTSTLDVNEIAASTSRPEQVIGLHFFSPANIMRLLEIVRGEKTSKEVIATAFALSKTIRKVGVLAGVCDGFIGNRMVHPYIREALFLLEEGATPKQVDDAIYQCGMAMGPHAMSDLAGLDVGWRIRKRQAATRPADERYCAIADLICERGHYGQKTGRGFYIYDPETRAATPDPEVEALCVAESERQGIARRSISDEEIVERCIYALVNEGARILEEGIALRASDIDVVYVYGYGFPAFRGGPMHYAEGIGLDKVYARICAFHAEHGKLWEPAPLLARLAAGSGRFEDA
ncbi:MAG: enoyl-CoA hydratase/isomerase family protein [Candidatus Hydrogenedentes bacterium]|nr:enoyl-CoA hydratase/isomerase family protein [Candidatus Hydrogenedentota bacterium]